MPDGTFVRVTFTPWEQTTHDASDNVLDSDWYAERAALPPGTPDNDGEIDAKIKAIAHADTPTRTLLDRLGRPFATIAHNGLDALDNPILFKTNVQLDIEGNPLVVTDANNLATETNEYAPGGLQLHTTSPDAGARWALPNALGAPLRAWDSRAHVRRWTFDALQRPTHAYIKHATDAEKLQTRTVYGESLGITAPATNHRGQVYRVYDSAGLLTALAYDFKGNLLAHERHLAIDYTTTPDWLALATETDPADIETAAAALLESETFTTAWTFDALGRVTTQTTPDTSVTTQTFGAGGLLQTIAVNIRGAITPTTIVTNIDYNARGQRTLIAYGNGSETAYTYDLNTFRVRRIHTERPHTNPTMRTVQDLRYHHDPSGNITRIRDLAQQGVFFANAHVTPDQSFTYDPTYRLIHATGREHAALTIPTPDGFTPISHPQDTQAQQNYAQEYTYDPVGNIRRMLHKVGGLVDWQRAYDYSPNAIDPPINNRLRATSLAGDTIADPTTYSNLYEHDAHGNMTAMPHIAVLTWDEDDRLQSTDRGSGGTTYYVYDSAGQRVRKVHLNAAQTTRKQRLYFGPWELYRDQHNINTTPVLDLERATLHVHDDTGRICLLETKTAEDDAPIADPANTARYQYTNHLGTASLELDDDAEVISYEEFHPYGTTSYAAANSAIEVSRKRYRYTGQERDEETGLAYHDARYYAPWLARWTAPDPLGMADGVNRYVYCGNRPSSSRDPSGTRTCDPDQPDCDYDLAPSEQLAQEGMDGEENTPEDWIAYNAHQTEKMESAVRLVNRGLGALQAVGGIIEAKVAAALLAAPDPTGLTKVAGYALGLNAADNIVTGGTQMVSGGAETGVTPGAIKSAALAANVSESNAQIAAAIPNIASFVLTGLSIIKLGSTVAKPNPPAAPSPAAKASPNLSQAEVSKLKNQLFLSRLDVGKKGQAGALARTREATRRFKEGTLEIPQGLTQEHLLEYRAAAVRAISKAEGKPSGEFAAQVQGARIDLIDLILQQGSI